LLARDDGKSLHFGMKLLMLWSLSFFVLCATPAADAGRKSHTNITRNEAQHLALGRHPGARVTAASLDRSRGRPVWLIEIAGPRLDHALHLSVDATSGRILSEKKVNR